MSTITLPPLPLPPTANTYYRRVGTYTVISAKGLAYRKAVGSEIGRSFWGGTKQFPLKGPLKIIATFHRPDLRRRDLDNLQKSLYDSLTHAGIYEDDSQIEHLDVKFAPLPLTDKRGTVEITIETFDEKL